MLDGQECGGYLLEEKSGGRGPKGCWWCSRRTERRRLARSIRVAMEVRLLGDFWIDLSLRDLLSSASLIVPSRRGAICEVGVKCLASSYKQVGHVYEMREGEEALQTRTKGRKYLRKRLLASWKM